MNKVEDIQRWWMGRPNFLKMSILFKLVYKQNKIPVKIPKAFFVELVKCILKCIWKHKDPRIARTTVGRRWWRKDFPQETVKVDYKTAVVVTVLKAQGVTTRAMERKSPLRDGQTDPPTHAAGCKSKGRGGGSCSISSSRTLAFPRWKNCWPHFSARTIMNSKCIQLVLMVGTEKKETFSLLGKKVQGKF